MVNRLWGVFCVKFCRHNIEYSTDASRNLYTQAWRTRTRVMTSMATRQVPLPLLAAAIAVQAVRHAVWQQRDLHAHSIFTRYALNFYLRIVPCAHAHALIKHVARAIDGRK